MSTGRRTSAPTAIRWREHVATIGSGAIGWAMLVACAETRPSSASPQGAAPSEPEPTVTGVPLLGAPDLRATLTAPSHAAYVTESLGVAGQSVAIRLTNAGTTDAALGPVEVSFTETRDGVPFPCAPTATHTREPTLLAPRQSFVFERDLTCSMPLPGTYLVSAYVALGDGRVDARGDLVGTFPLDVDGRRDAPRPYPGRPGLYVVMTGSRLTRPLPPESWRRGDYHVVVAFVNATSHPMLVGPAQLSFLTYRAGASLPCSGQAGPLSLPEAVPPGDTRVLHAPVTCAPSEPGRYEIVGRLGLDGAAKGVEIGRISLAVTRDPVLFSPELDVTFGELGGGDDLRR